MSKGRLKRRSIQEESGQRFKAHSSSSSSTDASPPIFSLHYMPLGTKYCLTQCTQSQKAAFADKLREMSQLTWLNIKMSHRHGQGCEEIPRNRIKGAAIPLSVKEDAALLSFRCIGKAPMVGYRDGQTFHIIWIDRDYSLYPHGRS